MIEILDEVIMDHVHSFGGKWTDAKLKRVQKYLNAYMTIMNKQPFRTAYIDAFAGTDYRKTRSKKPQTGDLFPELAAKENRQFLEGSTRIALKTKPSFNKYIFIEKDERKILALGKLKIEFPNCNIEIICEDANSYLQDKCLNYSWKKNRAVLFLDPYGMEIEWDTIEAVAKTEAIDMWLLFPLGVAINRLLKKDGKIDPAIKKKLNKFFGTSDWEQSFYKTSEQISWLNNNSKKEKLANFKHISDYFVKRLREIFPGVAPNPLQLCNSKNVPLYLLCFAAANKKGAKPAIKIASHILGH